MLIGGRRLLSMARGTSLLAYTYFFSRLKDPTYPRSKFLELRGVLSIHFTFQEKLWEFTMPAEVSRINPRDPEPYYSKGIQERFSVNPIAALQKSPEFATIAFHPCLDEHLARSARRIINGGLENEVPAGWPMKLDGPMAWTGGDFPDESRFIYYLSSDDRDEVRKALMHFKGK